MRSARSRLDCYRGSSWPGRWHDLRCWTTNASGRGYTQEVARIESAVRRRGVEGASDIIGILALDGRIQIIWLELGLGAGALLAAACVGIFLVVGGGTGPGASTFLAVLAGSTIALFSGVAIGTLVGFSRMKREPRNLDTKLPSPRLRDYCPPIVLIFPFLVLFGNLLLDEHSGAATGPEPGQ